MSDSMMQEILKRLDVLGEKLGNGAAYTWETYMRQEFLVHGILAIVGGILLVGLAYIGLRTCLWCTKKSNDDSVNFNSEVVYMTGAVLAGFMALGFGVSSVFVLWGGVEHAVNPQYYALMDIARMLGN